MPRLSHHEFTPRDFDAAHARAHEANRQFRANLNADIQAQDNRSAIRQIKFGARHYALYPTDLERLSIGLSLLPPRAMAERIHDLFRDERDIDRREYGFARHTKIFGLKCAALYSRHSRFVASVLRHQRASA